MDAGDSPSHRTNRDWLSQMADQIRPTPREGALPSDHLKDSPLEVFEFAP